MEIINNENNEPKPQQADVTITRNVYLGLVFIAIGALWMCYNLDVVGDRFFDKVFSWQMLLIILGGYFLAVRKWAIGGILFCVGAIFAVTDWFDIYLPISDLILPIIVIAVGLSILFQVFRKQ